MGKRADWEEIKRLGGGYQSDVFLVRNPERQAERAKCLATIRTALDGAKDAELAAAICSYARRELPSELGALKVFKIPPEKPATSYAARMALTPPPGSEEYEAVQRLTRKRNCGAQWKPTRSP